MRITPLDVRKQEFRKGMRGLDAEEVYAFLATVADEYESVLNDNKALRERVLELDDKVQEYRSMERTLRDTLLTAERVTVDAKDNARREANIIIKEAQLQAERSLRDIKNEALRLRQQVSTLRTQRESYATKMKLVTESHLDFIESSLKDFAHDDKEIPDLVDLREESAAVSRPTGEPSVRPAENTNLFDASRPEAFNARPDSSSEDVPVLEHAAAEPEAPDARRVVPAAPAPTPPGPAPIAPAPPVPTNRPAEPQSVHAPPLATMPPAQPRQAPAAPTAPPVAAQPPAQPRQAPAAPKPQVPDALADISAIINRMKDGQNAVLRSSDPTERNFEPLTNHPQNEAPVDRAPAPEYKPVHNTTTATAPRGPGASDSDSSAEFVAVQSQAQERRVPGGNTWEQIAQSAPVKPEVPAGNEITSEWDLDEIRESLNRKPGPPNK